ncbi:hypothetical protein ID866_6067 [Astraeus odoratus]|nr:hypothetical protein ID866_6067 [Astraeus odoratus]
MFKRVEKRRRKRKEEEKLGLDEGMKEIMGLNDTDSDETNSESESEVGSQESDDIESGDGEQTEGDEDDREHGDEDDREHGDEDEEPPISVEEALKDPVYLISIDPTIHGCILCKGKTIKNAGMATVHRDSIAHKRRYERFKILASKAAEDSNAWNIVRALRAQASRQERQPSDQLSKRALKRQTKQAALREKRKLHKELKAKAMKKKAEKKVLKAGASNVKGLTSPTVAEPSGTTKRPTKRRKLEQNTSQKIIKPRAETKVGPSVKESRSKKPPKERARR